MIDGTLRRAVKGVALALFRDQRWTDRRLFSPPPAYRLGGDCRRCARCCEEPAIRSNGITWYLPSLRRLFLWWQETVNGFVLVRAEPRGKLFVFRCTHFDWTTRQCDSYASRPGMCRDYPRALLSQPAPELLPGCGYRPVAAGAQRFLRALSERGLSEEQIDKLKRGLHLEE